MSTWNYRDFDEQFRETPWERQERQRLARIKARESERAAAAVPLPPRRASDGSPKGGDRLRAPALPTSPVPLAARALRCPACHAASSDSMRRTSAAGRETGSRSA